MEHKFEKYLVHTIHKGRVSTGVISQENMELFLKHGFTHCTDADHMIITRKDHDELCGIARDAVAELEDYKADHPEKRKVLSPPKKGSIPRKSIRRTIKQIIQGKK